MRICQKCSKQVSDESKICRDCGAILEEIPDEPLPGENPQSAFGRSMVGQDAPGETALQLSLESGRTIANPSDEEIAR